MSPIKDLFNKTICNSEPIVSSSLLDPFTGIDGGIVSSFVHNYKPYENETEVNHRPIVWKQAI